MSRTSVREALRALETQGLIVSRTGMGNFVADLPIESLVAPLAKLLIQEKDALADIFEMRRLVEPRIASLAAERATHGDIERMKAILETQSKAVNRDETGVEADAELHFAIGQATHNQALEKLVSGLMEITSESREESLQTSLRREASIESHKRIVSAINRHDRTGAQKAMLRHIEQVEESVLSSKKTQTDYSESHIEKRRIS